MPAYPDPTLYALGFMFDPSFERVALIHKLRPERFAGKVNGIGGKVDPGESTLDAMVREYEEEAGVKTEPADWTRYACRSGNEKDGHPFLVDVFFAVGDPSQIRTMTDEAVAVYTVVGLPHLCREERGVPDLAWTVLLAVARQRSGHPVYTLSEGA